MTAVLSCGGRRTLLSPPPWGSLKRKRPSDDERNAHSPKFHLLAVRAVFVTPPLGCVDNNALQRSSGRGLTVQQTAADKQPERKRAVVHQFATRHGDIFDQVFSASPAHLVDLSAWQTLHAFGIFSYPFRWAG